MRPVRAKTRRLVDVSARPESVRVCEWRSLPLPCLLSRWPSARGDPQSTLRNLWREEANDVVAHHAPRQLTIEFGV